MYMSLSWFILCQFLVPINYEYHFLIILLYSCASAKVWLFIVDPCMNMCKLTSWMWCTHALTHISPYLQLPRQPRRSSQYSYMYYQECKTQTHSPSFFYALLLLPYSLSICTMISSHPLSSSVVLLPGPEHKSERININKAVYMHPPHTDSVTNWVYT